jgi:hypothetical protein
MQCLTDKEVTHWLHDHSIPEDPYNVRSTHAGYIQFYPPKERESLDSFVRNYHSLMILDSSAMVHITDWSTYDEADMHKIMRMRSMYNENRWLIDAPGHLMTNDECEVSVTLFSLTACFGWSSYLYCSNHRSTLLNWEGDIFDFWTDSGAMMTQMNRLLMMFQLKLTCH